MVRIVVLYGYISTYQVTSPTLCLDQARSTFYVVQATPAKFCPHAGNVKFNTQNEE
jgi:hypothetical protein